jgi:hypothetical protein
MQYIPTIFNKLHCIVWASSILCIVLSDHLQYIVFSDHLQYIALFGHFQYIVLYCVIYNVLKMVGQYNAIYWRWTDNIMQYIEDGQTMQCNILKMVGQCNIFILYCIVWPPSIYCIVLSNHLQYIVLYWLTIFNILYCIV